VGKRHATHPLENNPFIEGFLDWIDSPEGQLSIEVSNALWALMEDVHLDPRQRKILWPDGQGLSIDQRILKEYPHFPGERIASFLTSWIEQYALESFSQEQLDELDRLTEPWVEFFAKLFGRMSSDYHVWVVTEGAPAFARPEGPPNPTGAVSRIELTSPRWPPEQPDRYPAPTNWR
jgi:hypothetical protein